LGARSAVAAHSAASSAAVNVSNATQMAVSVGALTSGRTARPAQGDVAQIASASNTFDLARGCHQRSLRYNHPHPGVYRPRLTGDGKACGE